MTLLPILTGIFKQPQATRFGNVSGCLMPILRFLLNHLVQNCRQRRGTVDSRIGQRRKRFRLMPHQTLSQRPFRERRIAGQEEIQRATETVDVGSNIDRMTVERLLRCQIVCRAQHLLIVRDSQRILGLVIEEPSQAHVQQLDRAVGVDQQVGRLDVAMHESRAVCVIQPFRRLPDVFHRIQVVGGATADNQLLQALAVDVLHHQEVNLRVTILSVIDIVRPHDIRVIDRRHRLSLAMKSRQIRRIIDSLGRQHFDRTAPLHQQMFGEIHRTHPALAQQTEQLVLAEREALVLSGQQFFGLPASDDVIRDQRIRDGLRFLDVDAASLIRLQQFRELIFVDEAALPHDLQERFDSQLQRHCEINPNERRSERARISATEQN